MINNDPNTKPAPRVTVADIEASIVSERYFTAADGLLGEWQYRHDTQGDKATPMEPVLMAHHQITICTMILKNGHKIVGVNAGSVSASLFDAEKGRALARLNALDQIWPLLGYALRERLAQEAS